MQISNWRIENGLTLRGVAEMLGISGANPARSYQRIETGEAKADADLVERIRAVTQGRVLPQDMHDTRFAWLKERGLVAPEAAE